MRNDGWAWMNERVVFGDFNVYRRYRLSRIKHPEPFAKSRRGKQRRITRLWKLNGRKRRLNQFI